MPYRSDARLLVLHGLRLKGVVEAPVVAQAVGLFPVVVDHELRVLSERKLVRHRDGALTGWQLTTEGRAEHQRLVAAELDSAAGRSNVEACYQRFLTLNPGVLDACSRWQVRELKGRMVRNDHSDPAYDEKVVGDLTLALDEARPLCDRLTGALDRYRHYGPRLDAALDRVLAGDGDYVAKPVIPSFHTVWFELHEDLLVTLGLDRGSEA
jgi:hypothetical protein